MVVMTAKLSKKKLIGAAVAIVALIVLLVFCLKNPGANTAQEDARAQYLTSFGYSVRPEPVQVRQVTVPSDPSEVFDRYNALQKSQGFDLSQYAGRNVMRYVYELEDYDDSGEIWYATILEYQGEIVGGDVASSAEGGAMHGFQRPA